MRDLFNNPGFVAIVGTLFGGAGLKLVEQLLNRSQKRNEVDAEIRAELRLQIESLRTQLTTAVTEEQRLESEVDRWKGLYYELKEEKMKVVTDLQIITERLREYEKRLGNQGDK